MENDPTGFIVTGLIFSLGGFAFGYGLGYLLREITALKDTVALLSDEQAKLLAQPQAAPRKRARKPRKQAAKPPPQAPE